jgi:hypothetical protein
MPTIASARKIAIPTKQNNFPFNLNFMVFFPYHEFYISAQHRLSASGYGTFSPSLAKTPPMKRKQQPFSGLIIDLGQLANLTPCRPKIKLFAYKFINLCGRQIVNPATGN